MLTTILKAITLSALTAVTVLTAVTHQPDTTTTDAGPTYVETLIADNDCWTGETPRNMQGVIPGAAVVSLGGGPIIADSGIGFAIWEGDREGTLHAFCK